ncbi:ATP-binding cassette sub-family D member 4-like [Galendromus occidentalis]|uniref:ATP-binding cassette sub-family D member 4-like n=1 Tax=Galendromus occidentalis TaxID=34638 RepID=A0AAJ7L5K0_9ACAR|nr:ATP-binding cassette sub-family D member 4-like [Galendromus occidentalis]
MPLSDIKIELDRVEFSKLPNIVAEVWKIFMTVLRESKMLCSFLPLLCILEGLENGLDFKNGMLLGDMVGAVTRQDARGFSLLTIWIGGIAVCGALVGACNNFLSGYATVTFRETLTRQLHRLYFRNHNFYKVNCAEKPISNPDQRIGSDVDILAESLCWMLSAILTTPFTVSYYVCQVGTTLGWIYSFIIVGYFFLIVFLNRLLQNPIVPRVCEKQRWEGRFRQQHLDIVENAERIAFVHGADLAEFRYTEITFSKLLRASKIVQYLYLPVLFVTLLDGRMVKVVTFIICGAHIFAYRSHLSEAEISTEWTKTVFVVTQLGVLCHRYVSIICYLIHIEAMIRRVAELLGGMDDSGKIINEQGSTDSEPSYSVRDLTVTGPDGTVLVRKLNIDINTDFSILITGPSNVGKSSFLRVLRKLWGPAEGHARFGGHNDQVMFLSQNMFFGAACNTLRKTLMYPLDGKETGKCDGSDIAEILAKLHLARVFERLKMDLDDDLDERTLAVLSSGERQRLALARVLIHRPRLVFLDEATNALDKPLVETFFRECRTRGIKTITVSHDRDNLYKFHDRILEFHHDSSWTVRQCRSVCNE